MWNEALDKVGFDTEVRLAEARRLLDQHKISNGREREVLSDDSMRLVVKSGRYKRYGSSEASDVNYATLFYISCPSAGTSLTT